MAYLKAVNEGNPVIRSAPKSQAADKLRTLERKIDKFRRMMKAAQQGG